MGYEILRGSREGNKSIIAKGMLNNLRTFVIKGSNATQLSKGLYPNYPFNTITPPSASLGGNVGGQNDPYIRIPQTLGAQDTGMGVMNQNVPDDMMTFHSPDTMFRTPFLSVTELKLYGQLRGTSQHQFLTPSDHPQFKLLSDTATVVMIVGGVIEAIISNIGRKEQIIEAPRLGPTYGAGTTSPVNLGDVPFAVEEATYQSSLGNPFTGYFNLGGGIGDF